VRARTDASLSGRLSSDHNVICFFFLIGTHGVEAVSSAFVCMRCRILEFLQ